MNALTYCIRCFLIGITFSLSAFAQVEWFSQEREGVRNEVSFVLGTPSSSAYLFIPAQDFTKSLGRINTPAFAFGCCNTTVNDRGEIFIQNPTAYQIFASDWIDPSLFVHNTKITIPLNELFFSLEEGSDPMLDLISSVGPDMVGGLINVYEPGRKLVDFGPQKIDVLRNDRPTYQAPEMRPGYVRREKESTASYESWKTPSVIYERAEHTKLPDYLGPEYDHSDAERISSNVAIRFFKWLYYDIPMGIVELFVKTPLYALMWTFILGFFGITSVLVIMSLISKRK